MLEVRTGLRWVYSFALAFVVLLVAQFISGALLASRYSPTVRGAYFSVQRMRASAFWDYMAGFHYWASALALLTALALIVLLVWHGFYRYSERALWWSALLSLAFSLGAQMSGNLLPMTQHDVRTSNIEASIASGTPVVGSSIRSFVLNGASFGEPTLRRWNVVHQWLFPILLVLAAVPLVLKLRGERISLLVAAMPLIISSLFAGVYGAPFGLPANTEDFASGATPPMWYVMPMHAMLAAFQEWNSSYGWLGAVLLPLLAFLCLMSLPLFLRKGCGPSPFARLALVAAATFMVLVIIAWGGQVQSPLVEIAKPRERLVRQVGGVDKDLAAKGKNDFTSIGCFRCHSVQPDVSRGIGPNLGRVGQKQQDPKWFMDLIKDPASKGRQSMPPFKELSQQKLRELAEYLRSLR